MFVRMSEPVKRSLAKVTVSASAPFDVIVTDFGPGSVASQPVGTLISSIAHVVASASNGRAS